MDKHSNLIDFYLNPDNWGWRGSVPLGESGVAHVMGDGVLELIPTHETGSVDLVISVGVHGNETAPIEMIGNLFEQLRLGALSLHTRTLILLCNLHAMIEGTRFCHENMNRLFSGRHQTITPTCWEAERAAELERAVEQFFLRSVITKPRVHYDLHTAIRGSCHEKFAVVPFRAHGAIDPVQQTWLAAAGVEAMVKYHEPTSTFSYFSASQCHAQAFTVELGKARPFGQNRLEDFFECETMLSTLLRGKEPAAATREVAIYQVSRVINRTQPDFELAFADDLPNFTAFAPHQLVARDGDQQFYAEQEGEVIIFPNAKVQLGHRAALLAVKVT